MGLSCPFLLLFFFVAAKDFVALVQNAFCSLLDVFRGFFGGACNGFVYRVFGSLYGVVNLFLCVVLYAGNRVLDRLLCLLYRVRSFLFYRSANFFCGVADSLANFVD